MNRKSSVLFSGAALVASVGVPYATGHQELFCNAINDLPGCGDTFMAQELPPAEVGSGQITLASDLGVMILHVTTNLTMDRTIFEAKNGFDADIVKVASVEPIKVDWHAAKEEGLILVTRMVDGVDKGIGVDTLRFRALYPEYDINDGKVDHQCLTDPSSPDYSGCVYPTELDQGRFDFPGLTADNGKAIVARSDRITSLKISDNACIMEHAIPDALRDVLKGYGIEMRNDRESADAIARIVILGLSKAQVAQSLNIPVQEIMVKVDSSVHYDPGPTYEQRLRDNADKLGKNFTDADSGDQWCEVGLGNGSNIVLPMDQLIQLVHTAFSSDGYDIKTGEFDYNDPKLKRPASYKKYWEQGYA